MGSICSSDAAAVVEGKPPLSGKTPNNNNNNKSPYYSSLPKDAHPVPVRHVCDGDTLTLMDGRRVRLLGIDTPELKKQAFAHRAKEYLESRCRRPTNKNLDHPGSSTVWISLENHHHANHESKDHYGRLLAWIWVQCDNKTKQFECVNEGIVAAGLAGVYSPNPKKEKLHNWEKLLTLQRQAIKHRRGIWKHLNPQLMVIHTKNGIAYHDPSKDCKHLKRSQPENLIHIPIEQALNQGYHACRTCCTSGMIPNMTIQEQAIS